MQDDHRCFYCQKPAALACPDCRLVSSCSPDHLALFHRPRSRCQPFKICRSPEKGLHMVATRDIKPMELILEETPSAMGPYMKTLPQCLQCFRLVRKGESYRCKGCGFPMCDEVCESGPLHRVECRVLGQVGFVSRVVDVESVSGEYAAITTLRTLMLKDSSPLLWESLQGLSDHWDKTLETERQRHQKEVVDFISDVCLLKPAFSDKDIHRVIGIMSVNNANLSLAEGRGTGLYITFARINHSCICNTKSIKFQDQRLEVRASVPIRRGEEITNQYVKPQTCTALRRPVLRSRWHFDCRCRRCSDPAELGSNLSALLCRACHDGGTVLPSDPLRYDSEWVCSRCDVRYSLEYVQALLDLMNDYLADTDEDTDVVEHYEEFLHEFSDRVHPNHQMFVDVQTHLAHLYGNAKPYLLESLPRPQISRKIQVCHNVLDVLGRVDPGYSNWRGKLLFELTKAKVFLAKRDFGKGVIAEEELRTVLREERFLGVYLAYYHSIFFGKSKAA